MIVEIINYIFNVCRQLIDKPSRRISSFHTTISRVVFNATSFTHPQLNEEEMRNGCRLGIDSFADTCVAGRHAHVISFIEGKEISAKAWDGHKTQNLRIANVAYAYDTPIGETIILVFNQCIY